MAFALACSYLQIKALIKGQVDLLSTPNPDAPDFTRIPNIGWRKIEPVNGYSHLDDICEKPFVYFVHSYVFHSENDSDIAAVITTNGEKVPAIVGHDNVWGFQFHPEKSGPVGLQLLNRFFNS